MSASNKDLALSIISYLRAAVANKEIGEDYAESLDVAIDCIADAFEVDKDADVKAIFQGQSLKELVETALKSQPATASPAPKAAATTEEISAADEEKANKLKLEGNKAMAAKNFDEAIDKYTEALAINPANVVYLSNRAAAYSQAGKYAQAIADSEEAIKADATFSKAYSRLGLAKYASGDAKGAMEAYKKGLDVEGDNKSDAMVKGYETAKRRVEEDLESSIDVTESSQTQTSQSGEGNAAANAFARAGAGAGAGSGAGGMPDFSSMFGGGAGGMPNFSELMNNPQIMQAAQDLMSNPGALEGLMNNPALRNMANQFMGGNGGPGGAGGAGAGSNN